MKQAFCFRKCSRPFHYQSHPTIHTLNSFPSFSVFLLDRPSIFIIIQLWSIKGQLVRFFSILPMIQLHKTLSSSKMCHLTYGMADNAPSHIWGGGECKRRMQQTAAARRHSSSSRRVNSRLKSTPRPLLFCTYSHCSCVSLPIMQPERNFPFID